MNKKEKRIKIWSLILFILTMIIFAIEIFFWSIAITAYCQSKLEPTTLIGFIIIIAYTFFISLIYLLPSIPEIILNIVALKKYNSLKRMSKTFLIIESIALLLNISWSIIFIILSI